MAKWIVNTVEDFITIEADGLAIGESGVLTAYSSTQQDEPFKYVAGFAHGFWLAYYREDTEVKDTT